MGFEPEPTEPPIRSNFRSRPAVPESNEPADFPVRSSFRGRPAVPEPIDSFEPQRQTSGNSGR